MKTEWICLEKRKRWTNNKSNLIYRSKCNSFQSGWNEKSSCVKLDLLLSLIYVCFHYFRILSFFGFGCWFVTKSIIRWVWVCFEWSPFVWSAPSKSPTKGTTLETRYIFQYLSIFKCLNRYKYFPIIFIQMYPCNPFWQLDVAHWVSAGLKLNELMDCIKLATLVNNKFSLQNFNESIE